VTSFAAAGADIYWRGDFDWAGRRAVNDAIARYHAYPWRMRLAGCDAALAAGPTERLRGPAADCLWDLALAQQMARPDGRSWRSAVLVAARGERTELPSARRLASTPLAGGRWDDLPGEGAPGRDYDQLPVRGADCEGTGVRLLKNAQHVGHRLAVTRCGPTPADYDPLADVGRCEPDLMPVVHSGTPSGRALSVVVIAIAL